MPLTPVAWLRQVVTERAVNILGTILMGLQTEAGKPWTDAQGNPYTVPMVGAYADQIDQWPIVVVQTKLGAMSAGMALGRLATDAATQAPTYGGRMRDSTITLGVQALSEAQRTYLVDVLQSGILFGYWTNPATGKPVDQVVRLWLAEAGILLREVRPAEFPPARPDDPRPEGQRYNAELALLCDIWVTQLGSTLSVGAIQSSNTVQTPAGASSGSPALTVNI